MVRAARDVPTGTLWIAVTTAHIARGVRSDESRCQIALAAQDAGLVGVVVDSRDRRRLPDGSWEPCWMDVRDRHGIRRSVSLGPVGTRFVERFDAGLAVEPFEVAIDAADIVACGGGGALASVSPRTVGRLPT